jgi:hypothetical protein
MGPGPAISNWPGISAFLQPGIINEYSPNYSRPSLCRCLYFSAQVLSGDKKPDGGKYFRFWSLALRAALGPRSHLRRGPTHIPVRSGLTRHPCRVVLLLGRPSAASGRTGGTYRHQAFSRSSTPSPRWVTRILSPGSRRADAVTGGRGHKDVPERPSTMDGHMADRRSTALARAPAGRRTRGRPSSNPPGAGGELVCVCQYQHPPRQNPFLTVLCADLQKLRVARS